MHLLLTTQNDFEIRTIYTSVVLSTETVISSVIRQKGESQDIGNKKQSAPNFPKNENFLPPDTHTYMCVWGGKNCSFSWKIGELCFLVTSSWDPPFCRRRYINWDPTFRYVICFKFYNQVIKNGFILSILRHKSGAEVLSAKCKYSNMLLLWQMNWLSYSRPMK